VPRKLFVNVPVADLRRSIEFFSALGFSFDPQFTDEHATCMLVSDDAAFMLLTRSRFADFTAKPIADPTTAIQAIYCISADTRDDVDHVVDVALASGGAAANPAMDHGFMYGRSFYDPDGHLWEVMWMDVAAASTC